MSEPVDKPPRARLYCFPEGFDFDAQPAAFQKAYDAIIEPVYRQLVIEPRDALERAAGTTVVFLSVVELLDQLQLATNFDRSEPQTCRDRDSHEKEMKRHLRLVSAKQAAIDSYLRVRKLAQQPRFYNPPIR